MDKKAEANEGQEQKQEPEPEKNESASEILKELVSGHREATCIAYTTFIAGGVEINFTMREGATAEGVKTLLLEMGQVSKWLKDKMKAMPVWGRDTRETVARYRKDRANDKAEKPAPQPAAATPPPAPTQTTPPPPATGTPLPPAPGQTAAPAVNVNKVTVEDIDFMRITAPSGKAVVEFRRKGRDFPEVRWQRGGEMLLEAAPVLAGAGYVAGHFNIESVGQEYHLPMKVSWIPSPKNVKWRDLTKIELVQEA